MRSNNTLMLVWMLVTYEEQKIEDLFEKVIQLKMKSEFQVDGISVRSSIRSVRALAKAFARFSGFFPPA